MASTSSISAREYRALAELRYVIRRFTNFSVDAARAAEIEPQQHQLLLAIKGLHKGARPTIGVLAERLQLQHNSAVELTQRAIQGGFIERRAGTTDRREVHLRITDRGERMLRRLTIAHRAELRSHAPTLARALDEIVGPRR